MHPERIPIRPTTSQWEPPAVAKLDVLAVDLTEAGRLLGGICSRTVRAIIARGELTATRVGCHRRIEIEELKRYLAANRGK